MPRLSDELECAAENKWNYCPSCMFGGKCCTSNSSQFRHKQLPEQIESDNALANVEWKCEQQLNELKMAEWSAVTLASNSHDGHFRLKDSLFGDILGANFEGDANEEERHYNLKSPAMIASSHIPKNMIDSTCKTIENNYIPNAILENKFSSIENSYKHPGEVKLFEASYEKTSKLIAEIEHCFTETASLVEKTLNSSNSANANSSSLTLNQHSDYGFIVDEVTKTCQKAQRIRQSMEEAITIFDSIIDGKPMMQINQLTNSSAVDDLRTCDGGLTDGYYREDKSHLTPRTEEELLPENDSEYGLSTEVLIGADSQTLNANSWNSRRSLFDVEIEELFRECYDIASIEPNTSLDSCLKNLENLCVELKKAKNNVVMEQMRNAKNADGMASAVNEEVEDELYCEAVSLMNHNRFSIINEIIEKKLFRRKLGPSFCCDPPLIGLEGKTHKLIAEVVPENTHKVNDSFIENGESHLDGNYCIIKNNIKENASSCESRSAVSLQDRHQLCSVEDMPYYTSNERFSFSGDENTILTPYVASADESMIIDASEGSSVMSHEENLALYRDNQELQESLLSVLHSLNDIHNNFLDRRRLEAEYSRQSSSVFHNRILTVISTGSELEKKQIAHDYVNFPFNHDQRFSFEGDFEAIENIIKISEELKNLWLSQTPSYVMRNTPVRKSCFSRTERHNKKRDDLINQKHAYGLSYEENSDRNLSKYCSLPNLHSADIAHLARVDAIDDVPLMPYIPYSFSEAVLREREDAPSAGVKNFIKQLKVENEKCYSITLHFLKKIMDVCKSLGLEKDTDSYSRHDNQTSLASF